MYLTVVCDIKQLQLEVPQGTASNIQQTIVCVKIGVTVTRTERIVEPGQEFQELPEWKWYQYRYILQVPYQGSLQPILERQPSLLKLNVRKQ